MLWVSNGVHDHDAHHLHQAPLPQKLLEVLSATHHVQQQQQCGNSTLLISAEGHQQYPRLTPFSAYHSAQRVHQQNPVLIEAAVAVDSCRASEPSLVLCLQLS